MNTEYTLSIIKPDAMKRNLVADINKIFTDAGLKVVAQKEIHISEETAQEFYAEHKARPFYKDLVAYISSSPVVVQVLAGPGAILKNREVMGATNPAEAKEGTVRKKYGLSIDQNSVHGSDSPESAKREISFFFDYNEITGTN
jgi:nucleoside-diphosphate kinase